jgi:hypothetical protein
VGGHTSTPNGTALELIKAPEDPGPKLDVISILELGLPQSMNSMLDPATETITDLATSSSCGSRKTKISR